MKYCSAWLWLWLSYWGISSTGVGKGSAAISTTHMKDDQAFCTEIVDLLAVTVNVFANIVDLSTKTVDLLF